MKTTNEMKNTLEGNRRLNDTEGQVSELADKIPKLRRKKKK